jgi:hypothetical protein
MDYPKKIPPDVRMRLIGLIVLFFTAVGGYAGIVDPLLDARHHERFITWYPEAAAIIPIGSIMGLFFLILGARSEGVLQFLGRNRAAGISIAVLLAVLAVAFGAGMLVLDAAVGMPPSWIVGEGPFVIALGAVLLWLVGRIP